MDKLLKDIMQKCGNGINCVSESAKIINKILSREFNTECLDYGAFSSVHTIENSNDVLKIGKDAAFIQYMNYCMKNAGAEHLLEIREYYNIHDCYILRTPRLYEQTKFAQFDLPNTTRKILSILSGEHSKKHYKSIPRELFRSIVEIGEYFREELEEETIEWDLHDENIMVDFNSQIVITDPVVPF